LHAACRELRDLAARAGPAPAQDAGESLAALGPWAPVLAWCVAAADFVAGIRRQVAAGGLDELPPLPHAPPSPPLDDT
jgi:hypothetical protein